MLVFVFPFLNSKSAGHLYSLASVMLWRFDFIFSFFRKLGMMSVYAYAQPRIAPPLRVIQLLFLSPTLIAYWFPLLSRPCKPTFNHSKSARRVCVRELSWFFLPQFRCFLAAVNDGLISSRPTFFFTLAEPIGPLLQFRRLHTRLACP